MMSETISESKLKRMIAKAIEEKNWVDLDGLILVRIPEGKRFHVYSKNADGECNVEYVLEQWYDRGKRQSRNRKVVIGTTLPNYPNVMFPTKNYYTYFDYTTGLPRENPDGDGDGSAKQGAGGKGTDGKATERKSAERSAETESGKPGGKTKQEGELRTKALGTGEESIKTQEAGLSGEQSIKEEPDSGSDAEPAAENEPEPMEPNPQERPPEELSPEKEEKKKREKILKVIQKCWQEMEKDRQEMEAARLRGEDEERLKKLYGEDMASDAEREAAARRLSKIVEEARRAGKIKDGEGGKTAGDGNADDGPKEPDGGQMDGGADGGNGEESEEEEDIQSVYYQVSKEREREAILMRILMATAKSIGGQARKHPDDIVNQYKARKINRLLMEIREKYQKSGYEDLLELIEEPREIEEDGKTFVVGMTYSDLEILLNHYETITEFIRIGKKKKDSTIF